MIILNIILENDPHSRSYMTTPMSKMNFKNKCSTYTRDPNIVGSIPVTDHLNCDLGQVTLLRLPRPLNET
jgi:hypothetical protein